VFTLLVLGPLTASSSASIREAVDDVSNKLNTPLVLAKNILLEEPSDGNEYNESVIALIDSQRVVWKLILDEPSNRSTLAMRW
jgi:hypothetical protein